MNTLLKSYGFEVMARPMLPIYGDVRGIYDEYAIFIHTNKRTNEQWDDSFLVFTFQEVILYNRKDFRNNCIESIRYTSKEELIDYLHKFAKVKDGFKEAMFDEIKEHLYERYKEFIKNENPTCIELMLPYNHQPSREQSLFIYNGQISLQYFGGTMYSGRWNIVTNKDYRNMVEFLAAIESFYQPSNIWVE